MAESKVVFCERCVKKVSFSSDEISDKCEKCKKLCCPECIKVTIKDLFQIFSKNPKKWFCEDCHPEKPNNIDTTNSINKITKETDSNDSGFISESPTKVHDRPIVEMLEKISRQCEDIKKEFVTFREESQQEIRDLKLNVEKLSVCVREQKNIIQTLESAKTTKETENIINHIQQQQLRNTIEISGLDDTPEEDTITAVVQVAASADVNLTKKQIESTRRLKNGKTQVTIIDEAKCNQLVAASFNKRITNSQTLSTKTYKSQHKNITNKSKDSSKRIFISNALTTTNQRIYKQLRDFKKEGFVQRISFFEGIFTVHRENNQLTKIYHIDQLKLLVNT
jgi:hypothetical protein